MRTLGAKDKVVKRNLNRMKSYAVDLPNGQEIIAQAHNSAELKNKYPNMVSYEKLPAFD